MEIIVFGKKGCGKCEAAKDKLERMGFSYRAEDLETYTNPHEGWREDLSVELMAATAYFEGSLPLIYVDGGVFDYPSSMRVLKGISKERTLSHDCVEAVPA